VLSRAGRGGARCRAGMTAAGLEWAMREQIRRMAAALAHRSNPLRVTEYTGGHDLACWRGDLADGLAALTAPW
jgi:enterochelin esterase-like enzyme